MDSIEEVTWKHFGKHYRISSLGVVESKFSGEWVVKKLKKSKTDQHGGYYMSFSMDGSHIRVHTFMWEMFMGPRQKGFVINHKDGVRENCALSNLEEVTQKENVHNMMARGAWSNSRYKKVASVQPS